MINPNFTSLQRIVQKPQIKHSPTLKINLGCGISSSLRETVSRQTGGRHELGGPGVEGTSSRMAAALYFSGFDTLEVIIVL